VVSVQVLNEFAAVSARKLGRGWAARSLAAEHRVSFYDALIVCAARDAGCERLYNEDLQTGRRFGPLAIINPFA